MSLENFWLKVGDRVCHIKDSQPGIVTQIDDGYCIDTYGVTTCRVLWDDCPDAENVQWTNKLIRVHELDK